MRNALKALGAVLAVVALCAPLMFLPVEDTQPAAFGHAGVTVTVPPMVVVATTIPGLETTTTTTEPPASPPATQPIPTSTTTTTAPPSDIVVAAVGEVLSPQQLLDSTYDPATDTYDFDPVFAPVKPYLAGADYAVASLQPELAGPEVGYASDIKPNAPWSLAFALKDAGIDLVGTANPHSLDLGWDGLVGTLDRLDLAGLAHVGTARTSAERHSPVIADIKGIRVAFLDYTSSVLSSLPTGQERAYAVNVVDVDTVKADAMTARSWGADAVVALVDYGDGTGQLDPTAEQVTLADSLLDYGGVDVILGSRTHAVQTIGHRVTFASSAAWRADDKYVAYSLGDFLAAPQTSDTGGVAGADTGIIAYVHFEKRGLRTFVTGVSYVPLYTQQSTRTSTPGDTSSTEATTTTVTTGKTPAGDQTIFRVLPVLPGLDPATDTALTPDDRLRMAQIWEYAWSRLNRPDEQISPLSPGDLGL